MKFALCIAITAVGVAGGYLPLFTPHAGAQDDSAAGKTPAATQTAATAAPSPPTLGIATKAPAIDVEHWIQDAGGKLKPVTEFEKGKVYVVEFWATWCGPCIQSMPHLAQLQAQYGDEIRIISITDETEDEVRDLLQQQYPSTEKTFDEVTAGYSLTADPDGSTHEDYMRAAQIGGIPNAFLVGKTGVIEWIGHPMAMDGPLEAVLEDKWDREAEKSRREREIRIQAVNREMALLARQGRYDEAMTLVDQQIQNAEGVDEDEYDYWRGVANSLKMSAGKLDDEAIAYYREKIQLMSKDFNQLTRFSFSIFEVADAGGSVGPLAADAEKAMIALDDQIADRERGLYHYARTLLARIQNDFDGAEEQMEKAVASSGGQQKKRFEAILEEIQKQRAEAESDDAE